VNNELNLSVHHKSITISKDFGMYSTRSHADKILWYL